MAFTKYHGHPSHHYKFVDEPISAFQGTIINSASERTDYFRYELALSFYVSDSAKKTDGTIYFYIRKDSLVKPFDYGTVLRVTGSFYPIPSPKNPNEFDYKKYLEHQNIYGHCFANLDEVQQISLDPPSHILKFALRLRSSAAQIIDQTIQTQNANAIAKALILGIKDHLDHEITKAYASAGAMHVLAVSGLHVGIIYLLLQLLFGKLRNHSPLGKRAFAILSILTIWVYAMVTGLSPSVLRAATMFSMVAVGDINSRSGNIYNTLGVSAFILLLYDPYLIYSVGFQLSYAAVFGIVYIQPKLYRLLYFKTIIFDKAWSISCVSIAAQLATFPLSMYYFHQFPTYFLISNLVVIPAAFASLLLGILMLILYPISNFIGKIVGSVLTVGFELLNQAMSWVESLPYSLIDWIYMDQVGLFLIYSVIMTLIVGLHYKTFKSLLLSTTILTALIFNFSRQYGAQSKRQLLVFYKIKNRTAIDVVDGLSARLFINDDDQNNLELYSFQINPNRLAHHLPPISNDFRHLDAGFQKLESFKLGVQLNRKIFVFDSTSFHLEFGSEISADIILIENEAVKNIEWLTSQFKAEWIILGNSNSYSYINKIKAQSALLKTPVHSIAQDGAFVLEIGHKKRANHGLALFTTNPD